MLLERTLDFFNANLGDQKCLCTEGVCQALLTVLILIETVEVKIIFGVGKKGLYRCMGKSTVFL